MKKISFLLIIPALFFQFAVIPAVQAGPLDMDTQEGFDSAVPEAFGQDANDPTDIRDIVVNIVKVILGLLGTIFVVLLVFAGFKWMTSGGNSEQVEEAKKLIINSAIGLLIILSSYAITLFITKWLVRAVNNNV
jgi:hypothetical protein